MQVDLKLLDFATDRQKQVIQALDTAPTVKEAAESLGIDERNVYRMMQRLKTKAAKQGYAPDHDQTHTAPDTQYVKGVSTMYDDEGNVKLQWVKTGTVQELLKEDLEAFAEALGDTVYGQSSYSPSPSGIFGFYADKLAVYPIGDPHIGMYAWAEETGEDFDLDIACKDTEQAVSQLVASTPPTETAIILNLGDFFHADNALNRTARAGHVLDVDTRWPKVLQVGAHLMKTIIYKALENHEKVIVKNLIGNHDDHSAFALALILNAFFSNNERVTVDLSPSIYWYYEFGNTLLGATHGHTTKLPNLPVIMAEDMGEAWGRTKFRHWYTGHIHTKKVLEIGSTLVESFRTLAGKDAWTAASGYRSGRDITSIVHHIEHGEVARYRVDIHRVKQER